MVRRIFAAVAACAMAIGIGFVQAAPASAGDVQSCGWHDGWVCIRIVTNPDGSNFMDVWHDKQAGPPGHIRLAAGLINNGIAWDDGPFWISAGQLKGYRWHNVVPGCWQGLMEILTPEGVHWSWIGTPEAICLGVRGAVTTKDAPAAEPAAGAAHR